MADAAFIALSDPADAILAAERDLGVLQRHRDDGYGDCKGCHFDNREEGFTLAECDELAALAARFRIEVDG